MRELWNAVVEDPTHTNVRAWLHERVTRRIASASSIEKAGPVLAPLLGVLGDWNEEQAIRVLALDGIACCGLLDENTDAAIEGLREFLEQPQHALSTSNTDDATILCQCAGNALAKCARERIDMLLDWVAEPGFPPAYAAAHAFKSILFASALPATELQRIAAALSRVIDAKIFGDSEVAEACLESLITVGPPAAAAVPVLQKLLGMKYTGDTAALVLMEIPGEGHRALQEALAHLPPIAGPWQRKGFEHDERRWDIASGLPLVMLPDLVAALGSDNVELRYFAMWGIDHMTKRSPEELRPHVQAIVRALEEDIVMCPDGDGWSVLGSGVSVLALIGDASAIALLTSLAEEGVIEAAAAVRAMKKREKAPGE